MDWRKKLSSNIILRNILASFGERSGYSKEPGGFEPYFQYKIGSYRSDQYLYFPKEPFPLLYKNEIFNKLQEYTGYDIIRYLEFHYAAYPDSLDFLKFLHYEISERLKRDPKNARLLSALSWVSEKRAEFQRKEDRDLRSEIERGVEEIIRNQPTASPQEIDQRIAAFSEKLEEHLSRILVETENGIKGITDSFTTGNIELNNHRKSPRSASLVIDRLIRMGLLRKVGKTLKLAESPSLNTTSISTVNIPLVGHVACGLPILAQENIETFIPVSTAIAKKGWQYFLLRACGDSMNEAGINDGDIILVRQQNYADSGRRVVALINDEATVKILDRRQDSVILRPKSSNSKHKPIIVTDDCQIQGEVIAVLPRDIF